MDYAEILRRVYEWNGVWDTSDARAYATCEWSKNNTDTWTTWIPHINDYSYDCNDYTDDNLKMLIEHTMLVNSTKNGGMIFIRIFSFICMLIVLLHALLILSYRKKHSIIRAASWKLTFTVIVGSMIELIYPWLGLMYHETIIKH